MTTGTGAAWVPPSHAQIEIDGLRRQTRAAYLDAKEADRRAQRAAGLERDRQEAIAAGWPVATDPAPTKARTTPRTPSRAPRPSSGPSGGRAGAAVPLPPGSLVLSAPEVAALDALLATPEVRRLLGAR